ncbi:MAG: hypothetical protein ACREJ2_04890 [Planctomycetota bacterium]
MKKRMWVVVLVLKWFVLCPLLLGCIGLLLWHLAWTGRIGASTTQWIHWSLALFPVCFFGLVAAARRGTVWFERTRTALQAGDLPRAADALNRNRRWNRFLLWIPFRKHIEIATDEQLATMCFQLSLYAQAVDLYRSLIDTPFASDSPVYPLIRWHNFSCCLMHTGRAAEALPWLEKEEALIRAHPEHADWRYLALTTRAYMALEADDQPTVERLTDELLQPTVPASMRGCGIAGHLLRSDLEMRRAKWTEALFHARHYLLAQPANAIQNDDWHRMTERERELSAPQTQKAPGPDWGGDAADRPASPSRADQDW